MTRLLCLADVHLGAGAAMLPPGERMNDQKRVLDRIADLAWDREVDAILVAARAQWERQHAGATVGSAA